VQEFLSRESAGQWLVVFDNADDIDMWVGTPTEQGTKPLIDYLPRSKLGCIVFTTRDRKTAVKLAQKNVVEVLKMSEDVATIMLQKCLINPDLVNNKTDTSSLLNELIYLPLAIVQASAYINENRIPFSDYLSLLADREGDAIDLLSEEFEDDGRYQNVKNPVATTWLISFEQIRQRDPLAAEYLSFIACIDSKDIPQSLLPRGQSRKKEIGAIGTLDAYSFVTRRPVNDALDLHRLVHLSTRNWLNLRNEWDDRANAALHRVEDMFPRPKHENRALWMSYQIHAQCVLTLTKDREKESKEWYSLASRIGECCLNTGKYQESESWIRQTLKLTEEVLGKTHPETLATMNNLAAVLDRQGKYAEAETINRQTLKLREEVLGKTHPDTLTSVFCLAYLLKNKKQYEEASILYVRACTGYKSSLGSEHPTTKACVNSYSTMLDNIKETN
jgi:tetratricopeptide (TPR) repeat protein